MYSLKQNLDLTVRTSLTVPITKQELTRSQFSAEHPSRIVAAAELALQLTDLTSNVKAEKINEVICLCELGLGKDLPRAPGHAGGAWAGCGQPPPLPEFQRAMEEPAGKHEVSDAQGSLLPEAWEKGPTVISHQITLVLLSDVLFICNTLKCFTNTCLR